jgi:hypothetical protein
MRADVGCMQMMTWKSFSTNDMNMINLNMIEVGGFCISVIFILPTCLVDGCAGTSRLKTSSQSSQWLFWPVDRGEIVIPRHNVGMYKYAPTK